MNAEIVWFSLIAVASEAQLPENLAGERLSGPLDDA